MAATIYKMRVLPDNLVWKWGHFATPWRGTPFYVTRHYKGGVQAKHYRWTLSLHVHVPGRTFHVWMARKEPVSIV